MNSDQKPGNWQESIGNDSPQHTANNADVVAKAGVLTGPAASTGSSKWKQKTVLLVDSDRRSCDSRAKVMRTRGVRVDCVGSANAARAQLASENYNLILVDLGRDVEAAESLVSEIRSRNARQLVQFLVGSPLFLATSLNGGNPRPPRASAPVNAVVTAETPGTLAVNTVDFGRRVKDAEAKEIANKTGAQ